MVRGQNRHLMNPGRALVAALIIVMGSLVPLWNSGLPSASAQTTDEIERLKAEREEFQESLDLAGASVDAATAEADEISSALTGLQFIVATQRDRLVQADRSVESARAAVQAALQRTEALKIQRSQVQAQAVGLAVQTYIGRESNTEGAFGLARTGDIYQAARIQTIVGAAIGDIDDTSDALRALELDTEAAAMLLEQASQVEQTKAAEAANELEKLLDAVVLQANLVEDAELRLDARLAEASALAAVDAELAAEIRTKEQALAARLEEERQRREAEARRRREEEARRLRVEQERRDAERRAQEGTAPAPNTNQVPSGQLTNIGGITVHESIASNLQALLAAAAADGIRFGGGGYRSASSQISLRRSHCGTSQYAIYEMPSSQCRPPTARPGASMHERGLAIDFTQNGRALRSNTSGYAWLRANGSKYDLRNLPSEPWHWSTNGR